MNNSWILKFDIFNIWNELLYHIHRRHVLRAAIIVTLCMTLYTQ